MKVVVLGATGNIGLATVRALRDAGHEVVGVARRLPEAGFEGVERVARDLTRDPVAPCSARRTPSSTSPG